MTIPYNAVRFSCYSKFIKELRKDGFEYENLNKEEKKEIYEMHGRFYENIKNNVKKEFFKKEKANFLKFNYNKLIEESRKEYKVTFKKLRDKYIDIVYKLEYDKEATERALEANNMHYLDAKLSKELMEKFEIIAIHDCFGIRLCELHLLMDYINEYYSKEVGKKTYNIFIIK
jgi:hypothetical protein